MLYFVSKMLHVYILCNSIDTKYKVIVLNKLNLAHGELEILKIVSMDNNVSVSHICDLTKFMPSMVSRSLSTLDKKGFIRKYRVGLPKEISLSDSKHALLFRDLVLEHRHVPFQDLLAGSSLEVIAAICSMDLGTRKDIHKSSSVSEPSVARVLSKLKEVGIVRKKESQYVLSQRFGVLRRFVLEFRHYINQKTAKEFNQNSVILWERNNEFIIESESDRDDEKGFHLTGPSAFGRFGINLFIMTNYHYYSPKADELKLEEVIVHSFLIPISQRTMLPLLLVWKKNEKNVRKNYLRNVAEKYGTIRFVDAIQDYFNSKGNRKIEEFPSWNEFASKAREYELRV